MVRRKTTQDDYLADEEAAQEQPQSITDIEPIVKEFVDRVKVLKLEEEELRERKKELVEEFKKKLDTKTLTLAIKMMELKEKVQHKNTFDTFVTILERE